MAGGGVPGRRQLRGMWLTRGLTKVSRRACPWKLAAIRFDEQSFEDKEANGAARLWGDEAETLWGWQEEGFSF